MITVHAIIIIVFLIEYFDGQVPKECATNFTLKTGICCPLSGLNRQPCGFPERGVCNTVQTEESTFDWLVSDDDVRIQWPTRWFQYLCKCKENYFGASCDECWYGWTGEKCSDRHLIIRRNVLTYSALEKQQFRDVLKSTREEQCPYLLVKEAYLGIEESLVSANVNEVIVNIHFFAQRPKIVQTNQMCDEMPKLDFAHRNIGFLTFHRHFMMFWERWVSEIAKRKYNIDNFSFPYWDWTDQKTCQVCTDDLIGGQADVSAEGSFHLSYGSPFRDWLVYCDPFDPKDDFSVNVCAPCSYSSQSSRLTRKLSTSLLPTSEHVNFTLSRNVYAVPLHDKSVASPCPAFSNALEGVCGRPRWHLKHTMHNAVHSAVFGAFSYTATSPNDPLFILHHIQIDRLFQRWWLSHDDSAKKYPQTSVPGHCYLCNQVGFIPVVKHEQVFRDVRDLGYDYDSLTFGNLSRGN